MADWQDFVGDTAQNYVDPTRAAVEDFDRAFEERPEPRPRASKQLSAKDAFDALGMMMRAQERRHPLRIQRLRRDLDWLAKKSAKKWGVLRG